MSGMLCGVVSICKSVRVYLLLKEVPQVFHHRYIEQERLVWPVEK